MNWIEVPIFCNTVKTSQLKDLGIETNDEDFEVRTGLIDADKIVGAYPDGQNKTTIINVLSGDTFELDLSFNEFKKLLKLKLIA